MERWQIVLVIFVALLPVVLMLDFWGDERVSFRGRPNARAWHRQVQHPTDEEEQSTPH